MSFKFTDLQTFCLVQLIGKIVEYYLSKVLQITKTTENEYK